MSAKQIQNCYSRLQAVDEQAATAFLHLMRKADEHMAHGCHIRSQAWAVYRRYFEPRRTSARDG